MIGASGQSWAVTLADLSIILFMITAADLSNAETARHATTAPLSAIAEPVAIYRPAPGLPPLGAWLSTQPNDPRQQLTIVVRHDGRSGDAAIKQGLDLAGQADAAGHPPRLIVEHAGQPEVAVILAYDTDPEAVARKLRDLPQRNLTETIR